MKGWRRCVATLAVSAVLVASGCTDDTPKATGTGKPFDQVTYLTGFGLFGRDSYAQVASVKGFFRDERLVVDIQPGKAGDYNLEILKAGKAQFVAIDSSGGIIRISNGDHSWKAINAIHQQTVISVMTYDGRGITGPKDLEGRKVGMPIGAVPRTLFPLYAKRAGLDPAKVTLINLDSTTIYAAVASGQVDAIGTFVTGRPTVEAANRGHEVKVLPYSEYITDLYGSITVASTDYLNTPNGADITRRFNRALLRGLAYTLDNPDEAGAILHATVSANSAEVAAAEVRAMTGYCRPHLGGFEESRVARAIAALGAAGQLGPTTVQPSDVVDFRFNDL